MNKLECQVSSCKHWCDNCCCLSGIQVDGPAARESSQTCCESYEEKSCGCHEAQNVSAGGRNPSVESSISCSAEHCAYNESDKCKADCVCVGCTCQDPTSKSGTECCTFRPE